MIFLTQFSRQLIYCNSNGNSSLQRFLLIERVYKCGKSIKCGGEHNKRLNRIKMCKFLSIQRVLETCSLCSGL